MISTQTINFARLRRHIAMLLIGVCAMVLAAGNSSGQVVEDGDWPTPLMDEAPFDLIYLDKNSDDAIIKIVPIKDLRKPYPRDGFLRFEFREDSEFTLQVAWEHVESYVPFNELLLEEAELFLDERKFSDALRNLLFVYDSGGAADEDVKKRLQSCLYQDAAANLEDGNYELALSIFEDLYRKDPTLKIPGVPDLKEAIDQCYDGLLQQRFEDGDAEYIKSTLVEIERQYGEVSEEFVAKWRQRFRDQAKQVLKDALQAARDGDGRKAHFLSRLADRITPGLPETQQIQVDITKQYPLIVVAVNQPAGDANPNRLDHWGSRRVGRLTQRTMIELAGLSDEGGRYQFLNGRFERTDDLGLEYEFILDAQADPMLPSASPNEIASQLLDHADEFSPNYRPAWAKILESVSVVGADRVAVKLRRPFVRPAALLRFAYSDRSEDGQPVQDGIYAMTSKDGRESTFEFNDQRYQRESDKQYPVVIEEYFRASSDATDALIRGAVDIVDRPALADIPKLRAAKGIEVRAYAIPTVHFLVPKIRGEYEGSSQLIRSLSTGIDREGIVNDVFGGADIDGCEPLSGPFPIGSDEYDQVSYGYDLKVKPLPYQQKLSMVLSHMARTSKTKNFPQGRSGPPSIVLAHPPGTLAATACAKIKQSWEESGITTTLRPLDASVSFPDDDNWDLLYVEAAIEEPLVDATRIMGTYGIAEDVSSPINQSLQSLGYAESWQGASRTLRRIHRQVSNDLSVIPLYQIKEHFAFRKNVYGLGRDLISLYQNIGRWRIEGFASEEKAAK